MNRVFVRYQKKKPSSHRKILPSQKRYIFFVLISLVVILGIFLIVKKTLWADYQYVQSIIYSQQSRDIVNNPALYDYVTEKLYADNIVNIRYFSHGAILKDVKKKYPYVADIAVDNFVDGKLFVTLTFEEPQLVLKGNVEKWGLYSDGFVQQIFSGEKLGKNIDRIMLPTYLSGATTVSGIFFSIPPADLFSSYEKVKSYIGTGTIEYLLGVDQFLVYVDQKNIFFNLELDIDTQLERLRLLKALYTGYNELSQIDLGSLDHIIIQ